MTMLQAAKKKIWTDGRTDGQTDRQGETSIPSTSSTEKQSNKQENSMKKQNYQQYFFIISHYILFLYPPWQCKAWHPNAVHTCIYTFVLDL